MTFKYYESPFHVSHDETTARLMTLKVDLSIVIAGRFRQLNINQDEPPSLLGAPLSQVSDLLDDRIENLTVDEMMRILSKLEMHAP